MGGPTGEVDLVDKDTGGFGQKMQEILFVPESELSQADKTRFALVSNISLFHALICDILFLQRYGSHGIESTSTHHTR